METTFSALVAICAGNSPVTDEFPTQMPVKRSFNVFFDLRLYKRLNKNCKAGDLRRHRAHYDFTVMFQVVFLTAAYGVKCESVILITFT